MDLGGRMNNRCGYQVADKVVIFLKFVVKAPTTVSVTLIILDVAVSFCLTLALLYIL